MSENSFTEIGRLIVNVLVASERLEFALINNRTDISDALYMLYSGTIMLINMVVESDKRCCRLFRVKYYHILPSDGIDGYLARCLSKLLSEWFTDNINYQEFIVSVTVLHLRLTTLLNEIKARHREIVCSNEKVQFSWSQLKDNDSKGGADSPFVPVYYHPSQLENGVLFSSHCLTLYAINQHYLGNVIEESLITMLLDFDNLLAEFELNFVCEMNRGSLMSPQSVEKTMDVVVLFAETVQWAHSKGLLLFSSIADCDTELMIGIPRLSVLYGCGVAKDGPLSEWSLFHCREKYIVNLRLAPVFQRYYKELARLRRQLNVLNGLEMTYLTQLLLNHSDLASSAVTSHSLGRLDRLTIYDQHQLISGDIHALFKLISSVSDQMLSEHASDYRFIMETIYKLYKDESDDIQLNVSISRSISTPDLFPGNNAEEAEGFPSFVVVDQRYMNHLSSAKCLRSIRPLSQRRTQDKHSNHLWPHILELGLGGQAPSWQRDSSYSSCCHCGIKFNLFRRRHHCRRCGYLFCCACWGTKMPLPYLGIHGSVPVCIECEEFIKGGRG